MSKVTILSSALQIDFFKTCSKIITTPNIITFNEYCNRTYRFL